MGSCSFCLLLDSLSRGGGTCRDGLTGCQVGMSVTGDGLGEDLLAAEALL